MRSNKNTSKIILAIAVAVLATLISYSGFSNMKRQLNEQKNFIASMQKTKASEQEDGYAYAVALNNLKAGEIVSDEDVDFKPFDVENNNGFENRSDVVNKVLLRDITGGDVFTSSHIANISNDNVSLKDGYRALTLPALSFQGRSAKMTVGSCVDIYSAASNDSWVLENVKILDFEAGKKATAPASGAGIMDASAITFEVSTDSISDFISNVSKNKLVLVARNPGDKKVVYKKTKPSYVSSSNAGYGALPTLPTSVPISDLSGGNFSGLPQPIQPTIQQPSVEIIEANVKSKVTFD